ncbi:uncharacterized protein F5Z01DRAFT_525577 [Emericellopsis atlantica]|uniref:Uncharacterized protein n=1 Tax=Emericellopsis atlantica TaxID=2614577 RepID=A0A9P7ZQE9_9HYPO|nr:uncharacterized protein F5Z01DRAFT_525577 [Emericellopsis atlantica]KAG9255936.1 hypothetical protein F5Z01DRAFT_525577 [Emericellopsis atlantica]
MAPVRRYLRITKFSVLECRIYLDNPALAQSWLLNPRDPVLPRVIESVRPWVLPKLREERDRVKKKSSNKKKGIKDTVIEDDFEVSIFLTETNTRHSILTKHKHFHDKAPEKLRSNTNKLLGATNENPVDLDDSNPPVLREESDDEVTTLADIPLAGGSDTSRGKQAKPDQPDDDEFGMEDEEPYAVEIDSDEGDDSAMAQGNDDKKKMAMDVSYEGFSIYGRVLCLVVRKKDRSNQRTTSKSRPGAQAGGQARMENWITSTQVPIGEEIP